MKQVANLKARPTRSRNRLQSVERSLMILGQFSTTEPVLGISELSRRLHLSKSIVYRSVRTMVEAGFLERDRLAPQLYRIGLRAFEVGSLYLRHNDLYDAAIAPMRDLAARTHYNVYLGVLHQDHVVYVATVDGGGPIQVRVTVGSRAFAHATAMGKVLLAALGEDDLARVLGPGPLRKVTDTTTSSVDRLRTELGRVRAQGHAANRGESYREIGSVAAPIRDRTGSVIAAVSTGFPLDLTSEKQVSQMTTATIACADDISRRLGAPSVS
jgi:IclR family KDG regulon transcriptional repressor